MKKLLAGLFAASFVFVASSVASRADTDFTPPPDNPPPGSGYWVQPSQPSAPAESAPYESYGPSAPAYYPPPYYASAPPPYYYGPPPGYYGRGYYGRGPGVRVYLPGLFFGFGFGHHHR
jgi:hypothetical protein